MLVFKGLARNTSTISTEDYDAISGASDHNPDLVSQCHLRVLALDDLDEIEMQKLEAAREAYAAAKEKQDDESIATAASARMHLQSIVMRTKSCNRGGISRTVVGTISH